LRLVGEKKGEVPRFGILLPQAGVSYKTLCKTALASEALGFHSLWLEDHFFPWVGDASQDYYECWTTLSAIAAKTHTIRLGTLCTCQSYRNPALLAKMASTVDHISGGRLELGIGAGWYQADYESYGYSFPPISVRARQLREAIQVLKVLWTEDPATFSGEFYSVKNARLHPKPLQKPHPPIWVGVGGERYTLKVAAELADGWNYGTLTPEAFRKKWEVLEGHCRAIGRDPKGIRRSLEIFIFLDEEERLARKAASEYERRYLGGLKAGDFEVRHYILKAYLDTALIGDPPRCIELLKEYIAAGVEHFMLVFPDGAPLKSLELFARRVLSHFG
jgi:F420-dependent oxidoreductase-like protein